MSLLVKCKCGKTLSVKPESAGKKVKCPGCGTLFTIPIPANTESPRLKEPLDIPFASASANPGNDTFWNELQRSGSSTNSNSQSEERSGPASTSRSTNGYLANAEKEIRASNNNGLPDYWWLRMYIKLNRALGIFFACLVTLALGLILIFGLAGSIAGAASGEVAGSESAGLMVGIVIGVVFYGFLVFCYLTVWFALGEFVAAILELTLNSRRFR